MVLSHFKGKVKISVLYLFKFQELIPDFLRISAQQGEMEQTSNPFYNQTFFNITEWHLQNDMQI